MLTLQNTGARVGTCTLWNTGAIACRHMHETDIMQPVICQQSGQMVYASFSHNCRMLVCEKMADLGSSTLYSPSILSDN